MKKFIILFGGSSGERNVSVASAQNIARFSNQYLPWFWAPDGNVIETNPEELLSHQRPFQMDFKPKQGTSLGSIETALSNLPPATPLFLAVHGGDCENGVLQLLLENKKVPFTASSSTASQRAFDKSIAKEIVFQSNIKVPRSIMARGDHLEDAQHRIVELLHLVNQVVVKPVADGSSIGVHFVNRKSSLQPVLDELSASPTRPYLVEERIIGRELTVGVYEDPTGLVPLPCSEVLLNAGREFDYAGKYLGDGVEEITPASLEESTALEVQSLACKAHRALGCDGYSRTDIILGPEGPVFIELNTLPGLSQASFIPQQLEAAGIGMQDFISTQLLLAHQNQSQ